VLEDISFNASDYDSVTLHVDAKYVQQQLVDFAEDNHSLRCISKRLNLK